MKTNEELRKDVMDEIKWDPELRDIATEIGVAAKDGVITLSGVVSSYRKKLAAEKAAQSVSGVKVVACDIQITLTSIGKRTDTEVAEVIKNALRWNSAVNDDRIEVKVDNGWVYLDGMHIPDYTLPPFRCKPYHLFRSKVYHHSGPNLTTYSAGKFTSYSS